MITAYDFNLREKSGEEVSLSQFKGKVLLIVNTATGCGFTPQYEDLEAMYHRLRDKGLEIIDIPCNQFGGQAPGSDDEILNFCQVKYGVDFRQFKKSEVNGDGALPLYKWLKSQKGFEGFGDDNKLTASVLEKMFDENGTDWRKSSDIKWNFTKFLINRAGEVVARFEPTRNMQAVEDAVKAAL